jgi:hypothetical protein
MATRVKEAVVSVAAGLVAAAVILTVAEATYDDPTAGHPPERPVCHSGGVRVTAGPVDAAMGQRAMDVTLENCGTRPYRVEGYPALRLLDQDQQPVTGVSVAHGSGGIATVTGFDDPPEPVTLKPGETATAGLLWRNTVTGFDGATNIPYLTVEAKPGTPALLLEPDGGLDLGTTGKLGIGPWRDTTPDQEPR